MAVSGSVAPPQHIYAVTATAMNYYVAPTGRDSNPGTASKPWRTLQRATMMAMPGMTVHVAPGEYNEAVVTTISGLPGARIRFVSDTKWEAHVRSMGASATWLNRGNYVDIAGFDISGDGGMGIYNRASFVRVIGNRVHDIPARGCAHSGGAGIMNGDHEAGDNEINGNIVHDIGEGRGSCNRVHGIYQTNLRGHIWNNIVYNNASYGIQLWHAANNVDVANNLIFSNGAKKGDRMIGGGIRVGCGDSGGVLNDYTTVSNNIIYENDGYAIREMGCTGKHNRFMNNLIFANAQDISLQNGNKDSGTVRAYSQFVNFTADGSGDYRLNSKSPAIDAGTSEGAPSVDFEGAQRPAGTGWDIGPYEWGTKPQRWPGILDRDGSAQNKTGRVSLAPRK